MDRATALRRLRACLRLSKSANSHEAAAALRQAQKLMAEYQLSEHDADENAPCKRSAPTRSRTRRPPIYISMLSRLCAKVFGCEVRYKWVEFCRMEVEFTGKVTNAEIAVYSFTVLRRQLERDIAKATARFRKRGNKAKYADSFGMGWVTQVELNIAPPTPPPSPTPADAALVVAEATPASKNDQFSRISMKEHDAFVKGMCAGKEAKVHSGMRAEKLALEKL